MGAQCLEALAVYTRMMVAKMMTLGEVLSAHQDSLLKKKKKSIILNE